MTTVLTHVARGAMWRADDGIVQHEQITDANGPMLTALVALHFYNKKQSSTCKEKLQNDSIKMVKLAGPTALPMMTPIDM